MINRMGVIAAGLVFLFLAASCGPLTNSSSTGGGGNNSSAGTSRAQLDNVPNNFSVNIPNSMKMKNSGGPVPMPIVLKNTARYQQRQQHPWKISRVSPYQPKRLRDAGMGTSYGYYLIRSTVSMMCMQSANIAMNFVVIDAVIPGVTPSAVPVSNKVLTFTTEFIDKIMSFMPDDVYMDADYSNQMYAMVGTQYPVPPFIYNTSSDTNYSYEFKDASSDQGMGGMVLSWSTDKKRVKVEYSYDDGSYSDSLVFIYDDSIKFSKMLDLVKYPQWIYVPLASNLVTNDYWDYYWDNNSNDYVYYETNYVYWDITDWTYLEDTNNVQTYVQEVSMKQDPNSAASGVFMTYNAGGGDTNYNYSDDSQGYADDNGGYITTKYVWQEAGTMPSIYWYKEAFNGNGDMTYWAYSDDGKTWVDQNSQPVANDYSGDYNDDYGEVTTYTNELNDNSDTAGYYTNSGDIIVDLTGAAVDDSYLMFNTSMPPLYIQQLNDGTNDTYVNIAYDAVVGLATGTEAGKVKLDIWYSDRYTNGNTLYLYKIVTDPTATNAGQILPDEYTTMIPGND